MTPVLRKLSLTAHIAFSVGWLGACAAFLVLSINGLTSRDTEVIRGAYLSMDLISRFIIVPTSLAALGTGLLMALGTKWGLRRYYWVFVKFLLTFLSVTVLLLHQFTAMATAAKRASETSIGMLPKAELGRLGFMLVRAAGLGMLVLLTILTLSVFKPWGLTRHGRRKQEEKRNLPVISRSTETPRRTPVSAPARATTANASSITYKIALAVIGMIVAVIVALHLTGHGMALHGH